VPPQHAAAMYNQYCASCHGVSGKGDGPVASALSPAPTDLTRSDLNLAELMKGIDGRRTVRAHGTGAMPGWGHVCEAVVEDRQRLREVQAVAEYVQSLRARGGRAGS